MRIELFCKTIQDNLDNKSISKPLKPMKDKLMWRLIAMLMIALCSIAAVAQTADSPIHITSLSEIKDLDN